LKECLILKINPNTTITLIQQPRKWEFDINGNPYYTDLPNLHKNQKNHIICQEICMCSQLAKIEPKESRISLKKDYLRFK